MERPVPKRVIWISTDHMRFDCIRAHGNSAMHTPNLDRLVNNGITFTNCFVQNPLCMPSRCSFMTGLYPQQTGVTENGHCLPPDFEPTVAKVFKSAGYHTAQIGKLHFQPHEDNDLDPRPRYDYGFDVFWLAEEPGCYEDAYVKWLRTEYPQYVEALRVPRPTSPERGKEKEGRVLDAPWEASFSGWIAVTLERFFRGGLRKNSKQFIHLGFYAPHAPLNPTREMFEPYKNVEIPLPRIADNEWKDKPVPLSNMLQACKDWTIERFIEFRRHFYAMVTGVDMAIGRVLKSLESQGMLDDTLIVFMSDHGDMCGDHKMIFKQPSFFDELMRMPCVLYWPKGFGTKGRKIDDLTEMVDLLPTLLELCGGVVPDVMAGKSYAKELLDRKPIQGREDVIAFHGPDWAMLRTKKYKYIRYNSFGTEVLYDLNKEPFEVRNYVSNSPEILKEMRERMLERFLTASHSCLPRYYNF